MQFTKLLPKQSLNKAFLKEKLSRSAIDLFKQNFSVFLNNTNANKGDEEHLKAQVAYFLRDTWYQDSHHINPIGKNDLVIHTGKKTSDPVGVIIEVKSVTNKAEMISFDKPNSKALHELVLYYLRQRIEENNNEIKFLVATNIDEWFIIDANEFDKKIYRNTAVKKLYEIKKSDNKDNPWFYDELKKLFTLQEDLKLDLTHFNIREFEQVVLNADHKDDNKLIALYKLLSPVHLLKLPFANDSNSLQPKFYAELLHLIGLTEIKEGSKKLIQRRKEGERNNGSLLENTIITLDTHNKISRLNKPSQYGDTYEERLFNVALELVITWINRILFLKLLEAQLSSYHKGDKSYRFLNKEKIKDFDDLDKLFFSVLAKKPDERREDIQQLFGKVPYLNSSLFEPTELEHQTLFIYGLEDRVPLPFIHTTVLKNEVGKPLKGSLDTIDYLFDFLEAYDFSSEGAEEIQEDNKTLINASVLGLIFEKINGYKDGSFFTPGFITMYMCRETIRRAVVQKFNELKAWDIKEYNELYDKIEDRKEANDIINSLKICDPAVGSGHFLVSALNEIIAIKSELRILSDREGRRLKEYQVEVVNDELVITDEEGQLFEYNPTSKESQRVQETLFHEKQTIIENCLFGVDINPNSVKICRLRLWIELLKNAYYRLHPNLSFGDEPGVRHLETLPNIDINIKTGNSLISRFALDADLKKALKKSKFGANGIDSYRFAVKTYQNARNKEEKREMEQLILAIKSDFRTEISRNDSRVAKLERLGRELLHRFTGNFLFEEESSYGKNKEIPKEQQKLENEIIRIKAELEEIKNNKIYENAFEWRFEFPQVLNNEGNFVGFDVVIGNPPYGVDLKDGEKEYFTSRFIKTPGEVEIYGYFIELSLSNILKVGGIFSFITTNTIYYLEKFALIRKNVFLSNKVISLTELEKQVFSDAPDIIPALYIIQRGIFENNTINLYKAIHTKKVYDLNNFSDFSINYILQKKIEDKEAYIFNLKTNDLKESIILKLSNLEKIKSKFKVVYGIKTGDNRRFVRQDIIEEGNWKKCASSANNIKKYIVNWKGDYLNVSRELAGLNNINYEQPKILIQYIRKLSMPIRLVCALDNNGEYYPLNNFSFIVSEKGNSLKLLLALLNSNLMNWYFSNCYVDYNIKPKYIERLPLPVDFSSPKIEEIIEEIAIKRLENLPTVDLEEEIDQIVYQLYGLTMEEIKIVEEEK